MTKDLKIKISIDKNTGELKVVEFKYNICVGSSKYKMRVAIPFFPFK